MAKHTLHMIGWLGHMRAYLDIPLDEAKQRYFATEETDEIGKIKTITFDDEFGVYDCWAVEK
jgi:hypothetical protein